MTQYAIDKEDGGYYKQSQENEPYPSVVAFMQSQQTLYNTYGSDSDSWYEYDISAEGVYDGATTCTAVAEKHKYNKKNGIYGSSGTNWWKDRGGLVHYGGSSRKLNAFEIVAIVAAALTAIIAIVYCVFMRAAMRKVKKAKKDNKEVYVRPKDEKSSPLIIS